MTERKVSYVSLRSTLGVTGLNWRGIIERMTMAEDAREFTLATGADFESDFRGSVPVGIMQPGV